jgi:phytoene dehydrogenase-like protein
MWKSMANNTASCDMSFSEIRELVRANLIVILIYLFTPVAGGAAFLLLRLRLVRAGLNANWQALLFALFFAYGGILEILLTAAFWEWSGMASIGFFLLLLLCLPAAILSVALVIRRATLSSSQRVMAWSTAAFPVCMFVFVGVGELLYGRR